MKIIFVRHGDPNYSKDCLTDIGHKQADAAGKRLADEKIEAFFSSSQGRAIETCEHIAEYYGKKDEIQLLDFMREVSWGPRGQSDAEFAGNPWSLSNDIVKNGGNLLSANWRNEEPFNRSLTAESSKMIGQNFDKWLEELGYTREGAYYRVGTPKYKTVILTSHCGSSSAVLSHFFNLPLSFVCYAIGIGYTSIITVTLADAPGSLVGPRFELVNDLRHIKGLEDEASK